jgi:hypothetical protein
VRHGLTALAGLAIAALTVLSLAGNSRLDGPVLLELTSRHGLHRGDLLTLGVAAVGLLAVVALHAAGREHSPRRREGAGLSR